MENSLRLYTLSLRESRTYTLAGLFVIGNILLPQLCHLIPQGVNDTFGAHCRL